MTILHKGIRMRIEIGKNKFINWKKQKFQAAGKAEIEEISDKFGVSQMPASILQKGEERAMSAKNQFTYPESVDFDRFADTVRRLGRPEGMVDVVLDTDTYNEIDDQFAIAYLLQSSDRLRVRALTAAPFLNHHSESPKDGMERSYEEIFRVLSLMGREDVNGQVYRGADRFLESESEPVPSEAAEKLITLSKEYTGEHPLYVVCIAAPVNIASALLMDPSLRERIVVLWSGGVGLGWPDCQCFNGGQNIASSRVLLESGVPLVLTPGRSVGDHLLTTGPELEYWLRGKNRFCDYIVDKTIREAELFAKTRVWSRPLTDVVPVSWLVDEQFVLDRIEFRPTIEYTRYYSSDPRRPMMRYVYYIKRDLILDDLFGKLARI